MRLRQWPGHVLLISVLIAVAAVPRVAQGQEPSVRKDVVYGEVDGQKLLLDIYPATKGAGARPALLLIHGGGWSGGNKGAYAGVAPLFTREGYTVISVGYRLAPRYHYPAQVDDVQRAVRWVRAHANELSIDPERIGALGHSAGGHLVQMLGVRDTRENSDPKLAHYSSRVKCVVNVFGPTDLTSTVFPNVTNGILHNFLGKTRAQDPQVYRDASPITFVGKSSAPTLFCHGTEDPLVPLSQSVLCMEALRRAGVEAKIVVVEGAGHGWAPDSPGGVQVHQATLEFLRQHLQP
ncbi:MAG: alpha/beta hydrolase [Armatimonadetes bacterium]|nr:alpha/beta hydrolase [Armatimonadota bacterium]